jgi:hypothetical protein
MKELVSVLAAASSLCKELGASVLEKELRYSSSASSSMLGKRWCWPIWWGHGRRPRASTESVSETSVACVVEAEEDGRVSEECHKKMGEQASAAGHGGRWPMTTSDERLGAGENR